MAHLSWNEITDRATEFASKWQGETYEKGESQSFWSDFLSIYGIDRRRHGAFFEYAIKKGSGQQGFIDMFWPGKLLAEQKSGGRDLSAATIQAYDYLATMPDHDLPQAIVLSDFGNFVVINLQDGMNKKVEFALHDLPKHVKLFAFLIEQQSRHIAEAHPVNVKAAEAMARLHNQLRDDNYTGHDLELLLVRLVFCMFADDSGIFDRHTLQDFIEQRTSDDGSDLGIRLVQVFRTLDTPVEQRQISLDEALAALPYVNGGLFAQQIVPPSFTSAMRRELLVAMNLDWSKVSPAIFGSMFQGVMDAEQRRNLGAHYTSEQNILRVIKPLFLDDLYAELATATAAGPRKKFDELRKLQDKLAGLKFLDPACGSGNFLVITYRELRRLEHKIVALLSKNADQQDMFASAGSGVGTLKVNVDQMYGIEIDEFPSLVAQAALWLTDHQMNMEYSRESGRTFRRLPLTHSATIRHTNALTTDWSDVVPAAELDYILGNPPFLGYTYQSTEQKADLAAVLKGIASSGSLDFVSGWYVKSLAFIQHNNKIQVALVSTNSITQGEQANVLWKPLFEQGLRINFAHRTFCWTNDAKGKAAVHCVIVGFSLFDRLEKRIFEYEDIKGDPNEVSAKYINQYLTDAPTIFIEKRRTPIQNDTPTIAKGSIPYDGGGFILSEVQKQQIIDSYPDAKRYIRFFLGSREFINNLSRWCLWLVDANPSDVRTIEPIRQRIERIRDLRQKSTRAATRESADAPMLFGEIRQPKARYLVIPEVSSENREYIPIGFLEPDVVLSNKLYGIDNATLYDFGILNSTMHMSWVRAVSGRLKSDYQYSAGLVYNNFIWPEATAEQKAEVERLAQAILDARAEFPDSSLADLYDPLTMPPALARAHKTLDRYIDRLYQKQGFQNDPARVAHLFELYREKLSE